MLMFIQIDQIKVKLALYRKVKLPMDTLEQLTLLFENLAQVHWFFFKKRLHLGLLYSP